MHKQLDQLIRKAQAKGQWALVAAATHALANDTVDAHINVLGAMHEVGLLKNSIAPFAKLWRADLPSFLSACVSRLGADHDMDYWALAALLGVHVTDIAPVLTQAGYALQCLTLIPAFKDPAMHLATLAPRGNPAMPNTLAPVLEIAWHAKSGEVLDVGRWRAVILTARNGVAPQLSGTGSGSHFMRARLPHGSWRLAGDTFTRQADALLPIGKTLWPPIGH